MMHGGTSLRTMPLENTAVNEMTSPMLLKIGGISSAEPHPHRDDLLQMMLLRWEGVDSVLWQDNSSKSSDQISSRLAISTSMMAPAILKNLFSCIKPSLRPSGETIG
jgi:hypothetical protein